MEIGDPPQPFRTTALGDGMITWIDLPKQNIDPESVTAQMITGAQAVELTMNVDFTLDALLGQMNFTSPIPNNSTVVINGVAYSMFSNEELVRYVFEAALLHSFGQKFAERYRDKYGFITYRDMEKELWNFPEVEAPLLMMLTSINVLWTLATDLSLDTNIQTAEGTNIDRTARYQQMMGHISALQERYERYCGLLNVGVFRMETLQMRRTSYTTGRLVPVFKSREYDDHRWPERILPPIDARDEDISGIPSPIWGGQYGTY